MQRVLFHETIFGPIHSRRLGTSLGVNLSPNDGKICSFDCLYCEAGFNAQGRGTTGIPSKEDVAARLEEKLSQMKSDGRSLDTITFSGNGEPTLHPHFGEIIDVVTGLRDRYFPQAMISVLSNATAIANPSVAAALRKVDNNILKLDSALTPTIHLIDRPVNERFNADDTVARLSEFKGNCVIQTMMLRGEKDGAVIDNTTTAEVEALLKAYQAIQPRSVMLYTIDRPTPHRLLEKVLPDELERIAETFRRGGINVEVCH
ncbi:MAG: radical SAM protein [Muribaculaceae bacterium]|nr:radical SAM protein [Muribaculaceae bacterium]